MRSLRTWLALGLALAIVLPAAAGAAGWAAASRWQAHRNEERLVAAKRLLATATVDTRRLADRLSALGLEAELQQSDQSLRDKLKQSGDRQALEKLVAVDKGAAVTPAVDGTTKPVGDTQVTTPGYDAILESADAKRRLNDEFASVPVESEHLTGLLFIPHQGIAPRVAIALAAAAIALAAALALAVSRLSRWVLKPLAALSADADRIAGGELEVAPVQTRASEVAQVAEALEGMAGALGTALGAEAAAERDRRFLVSAIAHDLRTPLFTLRGSLEAIERGIGDGDALARAQRKADHLDRLVGDLFAFSRAEYAREGQACEEVDLAELARTVDPSVEVVGEGTALGDPVALQRVMTNLIDNAIRHARSKVRVEVRAEGARGVAGNGAGGGGVAGNGVGGNGAGGGGGMAGARVVVTVLDDGPGFAPEDLPHVFEPLYRGDKARGGGGAGLGLAIARRLIRAHGGEIEAANDGGAVVTVQLPRAPSPDANGAPPAPATRHPA